MIELVMYGMIPSANTANWVSAPPEKSCRKPSTPPSSACVRRVADGVEVDARHGDERAEPVDRDHQQREQHLVPEVRDAEDVEERSPSGSRVPGRISGWCGRCPWPADDRRPTAAARSPRVPPAPVMAASADLETPWALTVTLRVSSPRPRILTNFFLPTRPLARRVSGETSSRPDSSIVSRLMAWYSTRNGLLKPPQLGDALVQGQLAALEAGGDGAAGPLALGAAAGGLAALAADAAGDPPLAPCGSPVRA